MGIVYIYVALALYNIQYLTLPMSSIRNIVDEAANVAVLDSKGGIQRKKAGGGGAGGQRGGEKEGGAAARRAGRADASSEIGRRKVDWRTAWSEGTDAVMDVPVGGVCEILYGM